MSTAQEAPLAYKIHTNSGGKYIIKKQIIHKRHYFSLAIVLHLRQEQQCR